jgi:hypothetical protein
MRATADPDRETFPDIADEIGEDPARFLDNPLVVPGESSPMLLAKARIRGIADTDTIEAWIDVETSLDRGPRKKVIAMLNQRRAHLRDQADVDTGADSTEVTG